MSDDKQVKISKAKALHDLIQSRSKYYATSSDFKLDTRVERSLYDKTAAGTYLIVKDGKLILSVDDVKKEVASMLTNTNSTIEEKAVFAIAEDEILSVNPDGSYVYPDLVSQYNAITDKEKYLTKFSKGITSELSSLYGKDKTDFKDIFQSTLEKLTTSLANGIDRYFEESFITMPAPITYESIIKNVLTREYGPIFANNPNFGLLFQAGVNFGVGLDIDFSVDHIITAKVIYSPKRTGATEVAGFIVEDIKLISRPPPVQISTTKRAGQAGHGRSVVTQFSEQKYEDFKSLIDGEIVPGTTISLNPDFLSYARTELAAAESKLKDLKAIDKTFLTPEAAAGKPDLLGYLPIARTLGINQIQILKKVTGGNSANPAIQSDIVDVGIELTARTFSVYEYKYANETLKASLQKKLKDELLIHLQNIAAAYARFHLGMPASSSPLTELIIKSIAESLKPLIGEIGKKELLKSLEKRRSKQYIMATLKIQKPKIVDLNRMESLLIKQKHTIQEIIKTYAKRAEVKGKAARVRANKLRRQRRKSLKSISFSSTSSQVNYNSITSQINMELKEYIIAEMKSPRLVNRTGRLASSAKITNATFDSVKFTYRKNPYSIFSQNEGKAPWNTPTRDPGTLIIKAIKKVAEAKYAAVFKNNVIIREV